MELTVIHNMDKWFKETGLDPIVYFNTKSESNRIGNFQVPRSIARKYTSDTLGKFFNNLGQTYIELALKLKPILRSIPFAMLEKRDQNYLREYICEQVQYSVMNKQIIQIVNASSISTTSFTMNTDTTPWAFTSDMLSMRGKVLLQNAEIDFYDIIEEDVLYTETKNGNIKILRKIDNENIPLMVWDQL